MVPVVSSLTAVADAALTHAQKGQVAVSQAPSCRPPLHLTGFEETNTSAYIRHQLDELKISYMFPVATTGISALIGEHGHPPVAEMQARAVALGVHARASHGVNKQNAHAHAHRRMGTRICMCARIMCARIMCA